ncbi:MAG: ATP-binding protein [bacterium]
MSKMRVDNKEIHNAQVFEILLDNFPDIVHSVDKDGRIVFTNRKAESLLGYTRSELLSMNVRQIYADEILPDMDKGFSELKKAGEYSIESVLKTKQGASIPVEIRSFSIYDDKGAFIRTFSILRDIRPIKELRNSLVHAGRLAAVGEMAAGIAHDISSPLAAVMLANDMLSRELQKEDSPDDTKHRAKCIALTENARRASQSIEKLVLHLRNFSKGIAEKREVVDIYDTITDALFITRNKTTSLQVAAENRACKGIHFVEGCPSQLEQVFVNLITNACDAMAGQPARELAIGISETEEAGIGYWKCEVADTGSGIPPHIIGDVFAAFFTTKEKGKGTGLGLSISRGIVREHSGDIKVVSEVGKGTIFTILLRKAAPKAISAYMAKQQEVEHGHMEE